MVVRGSSDDYCFDIAQEKNAPAGFRCIVLAQVSIFAGKKAKGFLRRAERRAHLDTATGPRAVLGYQRRERWEAVQMYSTLAEHLNALRAKDGSRSALAGRASPGKRRRTGI